MKFLDNLEIDYIDPKKFRGKNFFKLNQEDTKRILKKFYKFNSKRKNFSCPLCNKKKIEYNYLKISKFYFLHRCLSCSIFFPNIHASKINDYEKIIYKDYDNRLVAKDVEAKKNYRAKKLVNKRYEYCVEKFFKKRKINILEIGFGNGDFLSMLKKNGHKSIGIEYNVNLIKKAKARKLNVQFGELEKLKNNSFDLCVMFDVIEHLNAPLKTLKVLKSKLKKNGLLIFYTPNINSLAFELMGSKQNLIYPYHHLCFFSPKSVRYLSKRLDMNIELFETRGLDFLDYFSYLGELKKIKLNEIFRKQISIFQYFLDKSNYGNHMRVVLKKK